LCDEDDPFIEHGFLSALEESGSTGRRAGAVPRFVLAKEAGRLVGAVPLYLKTNSYGEFIFDWGWANAAHRSGLAYYPKLVAAIPFTPATGQRVLVARDVDDDHAGVIRARLLEGVRDVAQQERASSIHVLFCREDELPALRAAGLTPRLSMQFHWHNRPQRPYRDFDDYLGEFKSRHRKQVRHERAVAAGHGLRFETRSGTELTDVDWQALRAFYEANAAKHGGMEYLTAAFFDIARATYAHRVVATLAYREDTPVAGTLNFEKGRHLYGRYWGCHADYSMLHFELCYHRLIERAIARGATRFEAGAQGEHKLKRGLVPSYTHSAHWIRHAGLAAAVNDYIVAEADAVRTEAAALSAESPFHAPSPAGAGSGTGAGEGEVPPAAD
jgi:predicted N-acyltransferase